MKHGDLLGFRKAKRRQRDLTTLWSALDRRHLLKVAYCHILVNIFEQLRAPV
jgi:hypothetical protein